MIPETDHQPLAPFEIMIVVACTHTSLQQLSDCACQYVMLLLTCHTWHRQVHPKHR